MGLNYTEHLLVLVSTVTGCVSISVFASLVGILVGITSSAVVLKTYAISARFKKYNSIMKKKKKEHDIIVLLAKAITTSIEILISGSLIDLYIIHDKCVLVNKVKE